MSFNVRQSHAREVDPHNSWDNRADACLEMLQTRKPDLVGFQETQFKGQWSFFRDSLAAEYGSVGIGRDNGVDKGETSGFLYRNSVLTLLDSGTFWVSETPDVPSKSLTKNITVRSPGGYSISTVPAAGSTISIPISASPGSLRKMALR